MVLLGSFALCGLARAQITPPGLGNAEVAAWAAAGLRQRLDDVGRREYLGYVGVGSTSERDDYDPWRHPSIFVLNNELYDRFHENWMYSLALSYRRQDAYESEGEAWREKRLQELRLYARFASVLERGRFKLVTTVRPELRTFVRPNFGPADHPLQIRARLKEQLSVKLDARGKHRLIASAEELASTSRERRSASGWSELAYRESRFAMFYSVHAGPSFVVDVGYMNDLIGRKSELVDVHYLAIDVIWEDLFGHAGA